MVVPLRAPQRLRVRREVGSLLRGWEDAHVDVEGAVELTKGALCCPSWGEEEPSVATVK